MSDDGPVKIPDALFEATDEETLRAKREADIVASIEARLRAGQITMREADEELMALVREDFRFFSEATQAQIRDYTEMMLEQSPELVESREAVAQNHNAKTGDEE